jgi:tripartite-type tricarboxylate transporter receptor subunit TctC
VLPDVPTFAELNLPDLDWMAFFGLIAPTGVPAPVIERINKATAQVLSQPDVREKLGAQQAIVVGGSPEQFKAVILREYERQHRAVQAVGIKLD